MSVSLSEQGLVNPPASTGEAPERFLLLDGLRGVAAFAVILDHVPSGRLGELVPGRALSVDFFFVLSGFVLAHAYGSRLAGGWSPLSFMRARLIRLYPFYLLGLLIGVGAVGLEFAQGAGWPGWTQFLGCLGLGLLFMPAPPMSGLGGGALYPFIGPAWSLFFELLANFVYALVARFLTWRVFAIILPAGAVLLTLSLFGHHDVRGPGWLWPHFDAGLARVMFAFFTGVAIYRLRSSVRLPALPWWLAVIAFLGVIAVPVSQSWAWVYDSLAAIVLMPLLVAFASGTKVSGVVASACTVLGALSYGVYVLHGVLFAALKATLQFFGMEVPNSEPVALLVVAFVALAAAFGYWAYDKPARVWLSRALPGRAKREKIHAPMREQG